MSLLGKKENVAGLSIDERCIRILLLSQEKQFFRQKYFAEAPLERGVIENGELKNPQLFLKALKEITAKLPKNIKEVMISLPDNLSYETILRLPKRLSLTQLVSSIQAQLEVLSPIPLQESYWDWEEFYPKEEEGQKELLISVAAKKKIENYNQTILQSGLRPIAIETHTQSLKRTLSFKERVSLLALISPSGIQSSVIKENALYFTRFHSWGESLGPENIPTFIKKEVSQVLEFYTSEHPKESVKEIVLIHPPALKKKGAPPKIENLEKMKVPSGKDQPSSVDPKILNYVKKTLELGYSRDEIKELLFARGLADRDIEKAIQKAQALSQKKESKDKKEEVLRYVPDWSSLEKEIGEALKVPIRGPKSLIKFEQEPPWLSRDKTNFILLGAAFRGLIPRAKDRLVSLMETGTEELYQQARLLTGARIFADFLVILSIVFILIFAGSWLYLSRVFQPEINTRLMAKQALPITKNIRELETKTIEFNQKVSTLTTINAKIADWTIPIGDIKVRLRPGIGLDRLSMSMGAENVTISGEAATIGNLIDFRNILSFSGLFEAKLKIPYSSFEKGSDIPFNFSLKFRNLQDIYPYKPPITSPVPGI